MFQNINQYRFNKTHSFLLSKTINERRKYKQIPGARTVRQPNNTVSSYVSRSDCRSSALRNFLVTLWGSMQMDSMTCAATVVPLGAVRKRCWTLKAWWCQICQLSIRPTVEKVRWKQVEFTGCRFPVYTKRHYDYMMSSYELLLGQ